MDSRPEYAAFTVRPYQLLCLVCSLGEGGPRDGKLQALLEAVRENPDRPLTVTCNAGDVYACQDPGMAEDTPEGADYNRKRDLDLLQRMDWPPGITLPARTAFLGLLKQITTVSGLCGYDAVTSEAWPGCPKAQSGNYERGHQKGITAIIPPRSEEEIAWEKERSLQALYSAQEVTIRPHILLCAVCQYGGGVRPPYKEDNLPEFLKMVLEEKPDLPVTLVRGADWMMCAPCPSRVPELNACVCGPLGSGGLYNELKDLNVLQRLGLTYGTTMKASELYRLIFEKIPTVAGVCALKNDDHPRDSLWWDPCGDLKPPTPYEKGREMLMAWKR